MLDKLCSSWVKLSFLRSPAAPRRIDKETRSQFFISLSIFQSSSFYRPASIHRFLSYPPHLPPSPAIGSRVALHRVTVFSDENKIILSTRRKHGLWEYQNLVAVTHYQIEIASPQNITPSRTATPRPRRWRRWRGRKVTLQHSSVIFLQGRRRDITEPPGPVEGVAEDRPKPRKKLLVAPSGDGSPPRP